MTRDPPTLSFWLMLVVKQCWVCSSSDCTTRTGRDAQQLQKTMTIDICRFLFASGLRQMRIWHSLMVMRICGFEFMGIEAQQKLILFNLSHFHAQFGWHGDEPHMSWTEDNFHHLFALFFVGTCILIWLIIHFPHHHQAHWPKQMSQMFEKSASHTVCSLAIH